MTFEEEFDKEFYFDKDNNIIKKDTFNEDFPSFKGRVILKFGEEEFVCKSHVEQFCLDKQKVEKIIDKIKPKKYRENDRCFRPKELEIYTEGSHKFAPSMAIFVLSEIERYIERIQRELGLK